MGKPKMKRVDSSKSFVRKLCPQCDQQCPVALRECKCGFNFTKTKPLKTKGGKVKKKGQKNAQNAAAKGLKAGTSTGSDDSSLDKTGRRFRTKRMRPDFFNSLELEYASRTFRTRKPKQNEQELKRKKKRGRPKGSTGIPRKPKEYRKKEEEVKAVPELEDLYANFSQDRMQQFSFILDELNSKMALTMFNPL